MKQVFHILKKNRRALILILFLTGIYFITRLLFITKPLLYNDEPIYIRFAQIELQQPYQWLIPLSVGRQPLFIWAISGMLMLFRDPLFAGRFVSVCSGFLTLIGIWFVAYELFNKKAISYISCALYIFYPFGLMYDRLAILDAMVGTITLWSLYFTIRLAKQIRLDIAYTLGFFLGASVLTKSNAVFAIFLLPVSALLLKLSKRNRFKQVATWVLFLILSCMVAQILYLIIQLSPAYQAVLGSHQVFIYTIHQLLHYSPLFIISNFYRNVIANGTNLLIYLTPSYILLLVVAAFSFFKFTKQRLLLWLYFLIPFLLIMLFGKLLQVRYILFSTLPLLILAGFSLYNIYIATFKAKQFNWNFKSAFFFAIVFIYPAFICFQIIFSPSKAFIPSFEKIEYYNAAAGWGIPQSVNLFNRLSNAKNIFIGTDGVQGILSQGLEIYLSNNPHILLKGYFPITDIVPEELYALSKQKPTYFVTYKQKNEVIPTSYHLQLIYHIPQGTTGREYRIYQVISSN